MYVADYLLECVDPPEFVLNALYGHQAACGAATRRLKGQFQFLLIGQPTAEERSAWRT